MAEGRVKQCEVSGAGCGKAEKQCVVRGAARLKSSADLSN